METTVNFGAILAWLVKLLIAKLQQPAAPTEPVTVPAPIAPAPVPTKPVAPAPSVPAAPAAPAPKSPVTSAPVVSNQATGEKLVLSQTMNDGPMPGTGGQIHKLSAPQAATVVALILANCVKYPKLGIALMFAWIRAESDFDPAAIDPNADKTLFSLIPNADVTYLYVQAYNSGFAGAVDMARTHGLAGDWGYAAGIIADRNAWKSLFV